MNLLIISNYWHFVNEKSSSRYNTIAEMALRAGCNVEVVTSSFYHTKKQQRNKTEIVSEYPFTLIKEPSYKKNVSVKRIISHSKFAKGVEKYLKTREKPDVIYLFVPPTGLAKRVIKFANKNNIRVIIDVLDLWPEAFEMVLPKFVKPLLFPIKHSAEYVYKNADDIVAVSKAYVEKVKGYNKKYSEALPVYIGTDLTVFDGYAKDAVDLDDKIRPITMAYIGMFGKSYDLIFAMEAMKELVAEGFDEIEFLVMGSGPMREEFESFAVSNNLPVRFTGRLSYEDMVKKLVKCDFSINVLNGKSFASIINKHSDYLAAGIPTINIQKDREFSDLVEEYNAGFVCPLNDIEALKQSMKTLAENEELRLEMGKNARKLAEDLFDRNNTYPAIINLINKK